MLKLLPLLFLISCAKDLTVEEYRQQQSQEMLNQISLVSGTYSGTIVSKIDQENLGQLSISLSPQSTIQATSGVYSEQAASVSGQLIYYGIRKIQVKFDNAFFNPNSNAVIININNNPEEKIVIHGTIESGQFRGDIELAGQSNFGASFSLNKNARPDSSLSMSSTSSRIQQLKTSSGLFEGTLNNHPSQLIFIDQDTTGAQSLLSLLSPTRTLKVSLQLNDDYKLNFSKAIIDDKLKTLDASDPIDSNNQAVPANLHCQSSDTDTELIWSCRITAKSIFFINFKAVK